MFSITCCNRVELAGAHQYESISLRYDELLTLSSGAIDTAVPLYHIILYAWSHI